MFSPAIQAFDAGADLQVCAVNRPISVLASFTVFLIHLTIASLDTNLNGFVVEIKSAGSDDLVNLISRYFNKLFTEGFFWKFWICSEYYRFWQYLGLESFNTSLNTNVHSVSVTYMLVTLR